MTPENWPLVDPKDDGIRPAGRPDTCFYCNQKVGEPHKEDCVCVNKRVKVRYTLELEIEVPWNWDAEHIEFHRNEGSWCADNAIRDLQEHKARQDADTENGTCFCPSFKCEFLEVTDLTPRREIRESK